MDNDKHGKTVKQPYEAPKLRIIELAAEEVLAAGCKTGSGGSAFGAVPCTAGSCSGEGS